MEFSRPEYRSGEPFPPPGDLPNPGIEPRSPVVQADSLPAEPTETLWGVITPKSHDHAVPRSSLFSVLTLLFTGLCRVSVVGAGPCRTSGSLAASHRLCCAVRAQSVQHVGSEAPSSSTVSTWASLLHSTWDLCCLTRDRTHVPSTARQILHP